MTSKRYNKLLELEKVVDIKSLKDVLPAIKNNCTTKFDESIDISMQINNKQKKRRS